MTPALRLFRVPSERRPSLVLEVDGRPLDLSGWLDDCAPAAPRSVLELAADGFFERAPLESALGRGRWREVSPLGQILVPIETEQVGKVLALGKNFREHAAEFGEAVPEEPLFFNKLPETLVPHGAPVKAPSWYTGRVDHEAELAVVIGRDGHDIAEASALEHVAGYTVANDLTLRSLQGDDRNKKYPWFRAKNFDGACPLGPCFVPRDFLDIGDLRVTATVRHKDGSVEKRQNASTRDLVVNVPQALAWLSRHLTLRLGDIVLMGTPAGVGPLVGGDEVTCTIERIGALTTPIERS